MSGTVGTRRGLGIRRRSTGRPARLAVFGCANSTCTGAPLPATVGQLLAQTELGLPVQVHEIAVPCTGRLQPEHLLKAFEAGSDAVCVLACAEDNCHYLEGSRRASRRAEYVRGLLDEIGLGRERLMVFHLPGSAREAMMVGCAPGDGPPAARLDREELHSRLVDTCRKIGATLDALEPTPLRRGKGTM